MVDSAGRTEAWCIVVAGGSGRRFGAAKQFEALGGRRLIDHAVDVARQAVDGVVLVVPAQAVAAERERHDPDVVVVAGGDTRSGSVRAGLAAVPAEAGVVLVHDGARPLATADLFHRVRDAVLGGVADAAVPVVPVVDTIRAVEGGVVDRDGLRAVQTPQGFVAEVLRRVHDADPDASDDAGLVEAAGGRVVLVDGERANLKITDPVDLVLAGALLAARDQVVGADLATGGPDGGDSSS